MHVSNGKMLFFKFIIQSGVRLGGRMSPIMLAVHINVIFTLLNI